MRKMVVERYVFFIIVCIAVVSCNLNSSAVPTNTDETVSGEEVKKVQVIVQVSADVARILHQRSLPTEETEALLKRIQTFGLTLEPMHRNTDDPKLQSYFIVEVPDQATAQSLISSLQQSGSVEAAYLAPVHGLP